MQKGTECLLLLPHEETKKVLLKVAIITVSKQVSNNNNNNNNNNIINKNVNVIIHITLSLFTKNRNLKFLPYIFWLFKIKLHYLIVMYTL